MNERIDEIYQKSFSTYQVGVVFGEARFVERFDLGKFAELIVRECADLFEVEWGSSMLQGTTAAHYLKQHFGVEE